MKNFVLVFSILVMLQLQVKSQDLNKSNDNTSSDVELLIRYGHLGPAIDVELSPDGKTMASVDEKGYIVIWDIDSRTEIMTINGTEQRINEILFAPDSIHLIGIGFHRNSYAGVKNNEQNIYYWNYKTGKVKYKHKGFKHNNRLVSYHTIQLSADKKKLIVGHTYGFNVRDVKNGELLNNFEMDETVNYVTFTSDNKYMVASYFGLGSNYFGIKLFDVEKGELIKHYVDMGTSHWKFDYVKFIPGTHILFCSFQNEGAINRHVLPLNLHGESIFRKTKEDIGMFTFSADGKYLYAINSLNITKYNTEDFIYNSERKDIEIEGERIYLRDTPDHEILDLEYFPDNNYFALSISRNIFNTEMTNLGDLSSKPINDFNIEIFSPRSTNRLISFHSPITINTSAKYNESNNTLITCGTEGDIQIIDLSNAKLKRTLHVEPGETHANFTPDNKYIYGYSLSLKGKEQTKIWNAENYNKINSLPINTTITSSTGKYYIGKMKGFADINNWKIYDLENKNSIRDFKIGSYKPYVFIQNDSKILCYKRHRFELFDSQTLKSTMKSEKITSGFINFMTSSQDNSRILASVNIATAVGLLKIVEKGILVEWDLTGSITNKYMAKDTIKISSGVYINGGTEIASGYFNDDNSSLTYIFDTNDGHIKDSILNIGLPIDCSNDGKYLFTQASLHGKGINIVNSENRRIVVTLLSLKENNEFLMFTPDNYYLSTKSGYDAIAFKYKNNTYPFEQFDLMYNRPDIVLSRLPNSNKELVPMYYKAYQKRLKKMNIAEESMVKDFHIPDIELLNCDKIPLSTDNKKVVLNVKASDSKYKLHNVNVWINDVPLYGSKGIDLSNQNINEFKKTVEVELLSGNNKIQVSTLNRNGVESTKLTRYVNYSGESPKPNLYVVSIGASKYVNSEFNLNYAAKDAGDILANFEKQTNEYENVFSFKVINEEVTVEKIESLKAELSKSKVQDKVIVFYAGHGLLDENLDYYLATYNVNFYKPSQNGLIIDDFEALVDGIPARQKVVFIDACHSGEVDKDEELQINSLVAQVDNSNVNFRGFKSVNTSKVSNTELKNSFELMKELFVDLRRGSGAVIISAAGGGEFAFESSEWNNGVFTTSILDGLQNRKADKDNDGVILISELSDFVGENVKKLTNGQQNPTYRRENLEFDFIISENVLENVLSENVLKKRIPDNTIKNSVVTNYSEEMGEFMDTRDGKVYDWVKIGNQIWMAENLAFKVNSGCWVYENNPLNAEKLGYLYNLETANKVCPDGYKLPNNDDWDKLAINIKNKASLSSNENYNIKNMSSLLCSRELGFSALYAGAKFGDDYTTGYRAFWWVSNEKNNNKTFSRAILIDYPKKFHHVPTNKEFGCSVRCVKD